MATKTGINGSATWGGVAIADVRNINVGKISEPQKYASSSTNGQRVEIAGHNDRSIAFSVYDEAPPFDEGDVDTLVLFSSTGVELFNGRVHISNITTAVDIDGGTLITSDVTAGRAPAA